MGLTFGRGCRRRGAGRRADMESGPGSRGRELRLRARESAAAWCSGVAVGRTLCPSSGCTAVQWPSVRCACLGCLAGPIWALVPPSPPPKTHSHRLALAPFHGTPSLADPTRPALCRTDWASRCLSLTGLRTLCHSGCLLTRLLDHSLRSLYHLYDRLDTVRACARPAPRYSRAASDGQGLSLAAVGIS